MSDDFDFPPSMMSTLGVLMAGEQAATNMSLGGLTDRLPKLCARLQKFAFAAVAMEVSGLLTRPANQAATLRIEALLHLAAIHCRGTRAPTGDHIREWLNEVLLQDALGQGEDPPEDVFVSSTASFAGNVRIFTGAWQDPAGYLQDLMAALLRLQDRPWAETAIREVTALLIISETVAERAGVARFVKPVVTMGQPVTVSPATIAKGRLSVLFGVKDVWDLVNLPDLAPFRFRVEDGPAMLGQMLGHTDLERRPLLVLPGALLVVLPTAISAAARRHVLEAAKIAGELQDLATALQDAQLQEMYLAAGRADFTVLDRIRTQAGSRNTLLAVRFDEGSYGVLVLAGDDLDEALGHGLQGATRWPDQLISEIEAAEAQLVAEHGAVRGLTVLVHGGVGLGYIAAFGDPPDGWYRVSFEAGDFIRMAWDHDFDAKRLWKLLDQEERLPGLGYDLGNLNGFLNLYGYLEATDFSFVPQDLAKPGTIMLFTDYAEPFRTRVRRTLDPHLVKGPDHQRYVEVQRHSTGVFFEELREQPLYVAPSEAAAGRFMACVEGPGRIWWITIGAGAVKLPVGASELIHRIWDAAQAWMVRLAPELDRAFPTLSSEPLEIRLTFPDAAGWTDRAALDTAAATRPRITVTGHTINLLSPISTLRGYSRADNDGERWLVAGMAMGAADAAGEKRDQAWADALAVGITRSPLARFVHAIPSSTFHDMLQAALPLPRPRMLAPEDAAWARIGLADTAGRAAPGAVSEEAVGPLLQNAVLKVWERIRTRLQSLDRLSVVRRALLNHDAIDRDRSEWKRTAAALLSLYDDQADIIAVQADREVRRGVSGVACRAIAEMAICTSPLEGGRPCSHIDLDALMGDLAVMLECANQCDAHFYQLAEGALEVAGNGSFIFDRGFADSLHHPYLFAHQERVFRDGAEDYADAFAPRVENPNEPEIPLRFREAVRAEFGMCVEDLVNFAAEVAEDALGTRNPLLVMTRSALLTKILGGERQEHVDAEAVYVALTLLPRERWDEPEPLNARARDWQPWRTNRRLSLVRRPMMQVGEGDDPIVVISPMLLDRAVRRVFETLEARLPAEVFDTKSMAKLIGGVINERGHAFNRQVAARMRELGFTARADVNLTELGGEKGLGDVDVLAWSPQTGQVWLIECKRLLMDRTIGEIGERLADYAQTGVRKNKRTAIQKHLDRVTFLTANPARLQAVTGIDLAHRQLGSALVTDGIVPMQFTRRMSGIVGKVTDYRGLEAAFGGG